MLNKTFAFLCSLMFLVGCEDLPESPESTKDVLRLDTAKHQIYKSKIPLPNKSAIAFAWAMGASVPGLAGGSLALLEDEQENKFVGWVDESAEIVQAVFKGGNLTLDVGGRPMIERYDTMDSVLYQRYGESLVRVGKVEMVQTHVVDGDQNESASYHALDPEWKVGVYTQNLIRFYGIAIKGRESRVKIYVQEHSGKYSRTALMGSKGQVIKILDGSWNPEYPGS